MLPLREQVEIATEGSIVGQVIGPFGAVALNQHLRHGPRGGKGEGRQEIARRVGKCEAQRQRVRRLNARTDQRRRALDGARWAFAAVERLRAREIVQVIGDRRRQTGIKRAVDGIGEGRRVNRRSIGPGHAFVEMEGVGQPIRADLMRLRCPVDRVLLLIQRDQLGEDQLGHAVVEAELDLPRIQCIDVSGVRS